MFLELALLLAAVPRQDQNATPPPPAVSIEAEVLGQLKNQPLAKGTVDDLALPDEYLKRVADRIIRSTYEARYRIVVPDPPEKSALPPKNESIPVDESTYQPSSALSFPLVIGTILLVGFIAYLLITARARKEHPL
jgi:hypothetical protein